MENIPNINAQCCCFNLRKVTRAVTQLFDHCLEPVGVRATQFTLLVALANGKAKTLTAVSNSLVMDRTTLTRNLRPLQVMELITTIEQVDKRAKGYELTLLGRAKLEQGMPLWRQAQDAVLNDFGADKYAVLKLDLQQLQIIASNQI